MEFAHKMWHTILSRKDTSIYGPEEPKVFVQAKGAKHRQRRWLELVKENDIEIIYHPEKPNAVAIP